MEPKERLQWILILSGGILDCIESEQYNKAKEYIDDITLLSKMDDDFIRRNINGFLSHIRKIKGVPYNEERNFN